MQYSFSASFLAQIVHLAKEIAFHQRGERKLQEVETINGEKGLIAKYEQECQELAESEHPEEEWPDVVYYALCLAAQGHGVYLSQVQIELERSGLSQAQIEAITLAKYRIRAEGKNSKDFVRERAAIQAALS